MKAIAYGGRYLMMGFASDKSVVDEKLVVPRSLSVGNFQLCGVMLAYAPDAVAPVMKRGLGWNFVPSSLGAHIMREITAHVVAGRLKPVVGREVHFEALPEALEALGARATVGRTIVRLD